MNLFPDFRELLGLLNSARVKYLVLGGYAVNHYGHHRATKDLDIWIAADAQNAERVSRVMQEFGGFALKQVAPHLFERLGQAFMFGREPVRVDLLTGPSGVEFDKCYARRNIVEWDGIRVPLISFDDLKINKRASGRAQDVADVQALSVQVPPGAIPAPRRAAKPRKPRKPKQD